MDSICAPCQNQNKELFHHDGLTVVNSGIGVVNLGLVHDDVVVRGCEEPNIAQEALQ